MQKVEALKTIKTNLSESKLNESKLKITLFLKKIEDIKKDFSELRQSKTWVF